MHDISPVSVKGNAAIDITGIAKDSRMVQEGYMFFATSKSSLYIDDALKRGASVLVTDSKTEKPFPCTVIVEDVSRTVGRCCLSFQWISFEAYAHCRYYRHKRKNNDNISH